MAQLVLAVLAMLLPVAVYSLAVYPKDCEQVYNSGSKTSGVYRIYPAGPNSPPYVYCDMDSRWRKMDCLETIELLTLKQAYELRVDMEDFEGETAFAHYTSFSISNEQDGYRLNFSGFKDGGAGNALKYHNGQKFSTFDRDQDSKRFSNCAKKHEGGFWFYACCNPNGLYMWGAVSVSWYHWNTGHYSLKAISMKIRPVAA